SRIFNREKIWYLNRLKSNKSFVWLERKVTREKSKEILTHRFDGLVILNSPKRFYPFSEIGSHIIGFTDIDNNGISGIEGRFNQHLQGRRGWTILQYDGLGRTQERPEYPRKEPVNGGSIQLTIDFTYQTIMQEELSRAVAYTKADRGMGIIINPMNGEILAMGTIPAFDPNHPGDYPPELRKNSVITDIFEPGSTFKIVTFAAAFEEKTISPEDIIFCENGQIDVQGFKIKDAKNWGWLSARRILENSSNVGTIKIAQKIGPKLLYKYARNFGFGSKTGVALKGEVPGTLKELKEWSALSLAEIAIGYEISVTTIQLAYAYAVIANGGFLLKPIIIKSLLDENGNTIRDNKPVVIRKVISESTSKKLKTILRGAVKRGTGTQAKLSGIDIAGKTGTAHKVIEGRYAKDKYIASFAGFFPAQNPSILCLIIIDNPKTGHYWGGSAAAPVVREIFRRIANSPDLMLAGSPDRESSPSFVTTEPRYNTVTSMNPHAKRTAVRKSLFLTSKPSYIAGEKDKIKGKKNVEQLSNRTATASESEYVIVPSVKGLSIRRAISAIIERGLKVKVSGSGIVQRQIPDPGERVKSNSTCLIEAEP
ncbi:MAG: penicillin-binding protein, partial [Fidelibacterota bacterium]